eukprot:2969620-Pleurochrysis_carterae.AAC.1
MAKTTSCSSATSARGHFSARFWCACSQAMSRTKSAGAFPSKISHPTTPSLVVFGRWLGLVIPGRSRQI